MIPLKPFPLVREVILPALERQLKDEINGKIRPACYVILINKNGHHEVRCSFNTKMVFGVDPDKVTFSFFCRLPAADHYKIIDKHGCKYGLDIAAKNDNLGNSTYAYIYPISLENNCVLNTKKANVSRETRLMKITDGYRTYNSYVMVFDLLDKWDCTHYSSLPILLNGNQNPTEPVQNNLTMQLHRRIAANFVNLISPLNNQIIVLRLAGMTWNEIEVELSMPQGTLRSSLHRLINRNCQFFHNESISTDEFIRIYGEFLEISKS